MKIKFVNSDIANNFFVISNLAEWHFSCRREYNRKWLDLTGELNSEEEQAIKVFKGLMKKYGFDRRDPKAGYLGDIFLRRLLLVFQSCITYIKNRLRPVKGIGGRGKAMV